MPENPNEKPPGWFKRTKAWWYRQVRRNLYQWVLLVIGLVLWGAFSVAATDATDYTFSSMKFCAQTCHVMESTVYQEYKESKHYNNPPGVRPKCADCHVSRRLTFAMYDHFRGTKELWAWATHDFSKPGAFDKVRPELAKTERFRFLRSNSENCKRCHVMAAIKPASARGQNAHRTAMQNGNSNCIVCHYNLVHKHVPPSKEFEEAAAKYLGGAGAGKVEEKLSGEGAQM